MERRSHSDPIVYIKTTPRMRRSAGRRRTTVRIRFILQPTGSISCKAGNKQHVQTDSRRGDRIKTHAVSMRSSTRVASHRDEYTIINNQSGTSRGAFSPFDYPRLWWRKTQASIDPIPAAQHANRLNCRSPPGWANHNYRIRTSQPIRATDQSSAYTPEESINA